MRNKSNRAGGVERGGQCPDAEGLEVIVRCSEAMETQALVKILLSSKLTFATHLAPKQRRSTHTTTATDY